MNSALMLPEPAHPSPQVLTTWSDQQLRDELARSLTVTARTLQYLASIWRELENRGVDLSEMRSGLGKYLPMIAAGQLDADAVVKFAGQRALIRAVSSLTVDDQRRLAAGETLSVMRLAADGKIEQTQLRAGELTASQVRLVFDEGRIRNPDEQRRMLESATGAARRRQDGAPAPVRIERDGSLRVSRNRTVRMSAIMGALAAAAPEVDEIDRDDMKQVPIIFSPAEHRSLKVAAAHAGISVSRLIRVTLAQAGLFSEE